MLNKEIWEKQLMENFYPERSFLRRVMDFSHDVNANKLHIPSAGIDPKVLINNTTYPIAVVGREDEDCEIALEKFETENTLIRRPEAIEYSYEKVESVIRQHRATLQANTARKAVHAFAPASDSKDTPVIMTTGEAYNGRKRLRSVDILSLKERFDDALIPLEDRYIVLSPKHISDLLFENLSMFKDIANVQSGEPFKFAGFGIYSFPYMPTYRSGVKVAYDAPAQTGDLFASVAFYGREVMKADGDLHMYSVVDDPRERGTIIGFDKRFIAMPVRNKGIGAIVSSMAV
ncbi:MAG: hypothetical protein U0L66_05135 [Acutalibacteraceae bacterium]|nr:hypothetical protein [Acutalibacteraceae bacterium]